MTREEAIKIMKTSPIGGRWEEDWIDRLVALGALKLDEPPSLDARINTAINMELLSGREKCAGNIKEALDRAGFKIVEK